jgi:hypothetical protein
MQYEGVDLFTVIAACPLNVIPVTDSKAARGHSALNLYTDRRLLEAHPSSDKSCTK